MKTIPFSIILSFFFTVSSSLNAQTPDSSLVLHIEVDGAVQDLSVYEHNVMDESMRLVPDRFRRPDHAFELDGESNFVRIEHSDLFNFAGSDLTYSLWCNVDIFHDRITHALISKRNSSSTGAGFLLQYFGPDHPFGDPAGTYNMVFGGYTDPQIDAQSSLDNKAWIHVAMTYDADINYAQFYENGTLIGGATIGGPLNNLADIVIGKDDATDGVPINVGIPGYTGGYHVKGQIDDVRIYNRRLNADEIGDLFSEVPVSVQDQYLADVKLGPNPATNQVVLTTPEELKLNAVQLFSLDGKLIAEYPGEQRVFQVADLPQGAYTLSLVAPATKRGFTFVKQ